MVQSHGEVFYFFSCRFGDLFSDFMVKKLPPPTPIGVKGGCSPQNNRENSEAANELPANRNKFRLISALS